jgi:hypothetical protein
MVPSSARAVTVHQPGGDAVVRFATGSGGGAGAGSGGPVTLEGPARFDSRHHVTLGAS